MTAPTRPPRSRSLPLVKSRAWAPRLARDTPPPAGARALLADAHGALADAHDRQRARRRGRRDAGRARACGRVPRGTPRYTPAASPSRTGRPRTTCGTRCIGGTSLQRPVPELRWINIPPRPPTPSRGALGHDPAARWIRLRPPLKPGVHRSRMHVERDARGPGPKQRREAGDVLSRGEGRAVGSQRSPGRCVRSAERRPHRAARASFCRTRRRRARADRGSRTHPSRREPPRRDVAPITNEFAPGVHRSRMRLDARPEQQRQAEQCGLERRGPCGGVAAEPRTLRPLSGAEALQCGPSGRGTRALRRPRARGRRRRRRSPVGSPDLAAPRRPRR